MKKAALLLTLMSLLGLAPALAQNDDNPTVAFLKWGDSSNVALAEKAIYDTLEVYGLINADERALLDQERSFEGEHLNVVYGDALFDRLEANVIIERAIDRGADVLVTFTTQMTQITYYAIREFYRSAEADFHRDFGTLHYRRGRIILHQAGFCHRHRTRDEL